MERAELLLELGKIVGESNIVFHPDDLLVYEYDGSVDRGIPSMVVLPATSDEVSQVVALAYQEGMPVAGRGSGTGLSGGAIAAPEGMQIAFTRMNRILGVNTENRTAVVEPGVINLDLDNHVRKSGLRYAPDPSSQRACSLGGNIAENAGGPHCLAYGTTTNHVLGMEVVLEDGSMVNLGSPIDEPVREVPGYDLRGAFVGSEGTFGIATKIVVRLLPVPQTVKTILGAFPDINEACTSVSSIIAQGIVPAALEMMDANTIRAVQANMDAGYPNDAGAVLLVELEGLHEEVEEDANRVEAALWDTGAVQVNVAQQEEERVKLWLGRKTAFGAFGNIAPNMYLVDGVVPRTKLTQVLAEVGEIGRQYDIVIANVFHAGDGNLHPCILFDEREPGALERATEASGEILRVCVAAGGSLSGEHGVGLEKKEYMSLVFTGEDMAAMQRVRDSFAPKNRLNPGKIFPDGEPYQPAAYRPSAGMSA